MRTDSAGKLAIALKHWHVKRVKREPLDKSPIVSVGYCEEQQRLEIEFKGGRVYEYLEVPPSVHRWLLRVEDKAGFIQRMLTPGYRYRRVAPPSSALDAEGDAGELEGALRRSLAALEKR